MKFTIFTPFFNYLDASDSLCDAILNQTYPNWEWIIFDDFSDNDMVIPKLIELSKRDSRIKLIHQEFKGQFYLNFPLIHSSGDIIVKQDSDDIPYPKLLEVYKYNYDKFPGVVSIGSSSLLSKESFSGYTAGAKYINYNKSGNYIESMKNNVYSCIGDCRSYRVNLIPNNGTIYPNLDFPLSYGEDVIRTIVMEEVGSIIALPRILHRYTMRSNSQSGGLTINQESTLENKIKTDNLMDNIISESKIRVNRDELISIENYYDESFDHLKNFYFSGIENEIESHNIEYWSNNISSRDIKKIKETYFDHKLFFNKKINDPKFIIIDSINSPISLIDEAIKNRDIINCDITITTSNSNIDEISEKIRIMGHPYWYNIHYYCTIKITKK
jgi:glycosyltransferase involved in cell wall biosynthesis